MSGRRRLLAWVAQPLVIGLVLWTALDASRHDPHIPLSFSGDALFHLAQSKTTLEQGWWWTAPFLGAPFTHNALLAPQGANVNQAIVRIAGVFTHDLVTAVTASWVLMVLVSGLTSAWCLRRLGLSRTGAWVAGVLFALSPFALAGNVSHLDLTLYLLPFPATTALLLASRSDVSWRWREMRGLVAGNLLVGMNALDYAVFGGCLIAIGALIGALRRRQLGALTGGGAMLAAVAITAMLAHAPTVLAWQRQGKPDPLRYGPAVAEIHGLKVRHLVSPVPGHWFPPFQAWLDRERQAAFPLEAESRISRLGLLVSISFLGLLLVALVPRLAGQDQDGELTHNASRLVLAAVLLGTLGGVGSLVSMFVWGTTASYSRLTPFIAFFALAAAGGWIDRARVTSGRTRASLWIALLVIGTLDQIGALRPIVDQKRAVTFEVRQLKGMVTRLEGLVPPGAMIYQLPIRIYPANGTVAPAAAYDHLKFPVLSHTLRWSYPALSRAQVQWQEKTASIDPQQLPMHLAKEGFSAILVDRLGYEDHGQALIATLQASAHAQLIDQTERYILFDIRPAAPRS